MLIRKGLYDRKDTLSFESSGVTAKIVASECLKETVEVINIDSVKECRDASFIKMDIEGAELFALEGAKETIRRNRPKLAICIYHSDEDMLRIIEWIHALAPEYQLYVRHHSRSDVETVLYAVI